VSGRIPLALVLFVPIAGQAATCPPLKLCVPKPVPILDSTRLGLSTESAAAAEGALEAWKSAENLTGNLRASLGAQGAPTLSVRRDLPLAHALESAMPPKLAGPSGDGFDVAQATLRAVQARVDANLYAARADVPPIELAGVQRRRTAAARAARGDALADALAYRAAMRNESNEAADIRSGRTGAQTLRDDVAVNQRARILLARRFDEVALLLARYLELVAAGQFATQPAAIPFAAAARDAGTRTDPERAGALQYRLQEVLRRAAADTDRRRVALRQSSTLAEGTGTIVETATRISTALRQSFPDAVQAATPALDQVLRTLYVDPVTVKRALYEAASAGADAMSWNSFATAALADPDAAAQAGDADLTRSWAASVSASDAALAALADDPTRGGALLLAPEAAAAALAQLRQGDALAELAAWAQSKRLADANAEVRGWLDDAAQLAREARVPDVPFAPSWDWQNFKSQKAH
jgi:hypothetical protein